MTGQLPTLFVPWLLNFHMSTWCLWIVWRTFGAYFDHRWDQKNDIPNKIKWLWIPYQALGRAKSTPRLAPHPQHRKFRSWNLRLGQYFWHPRSLSGTPKKEWEEKALYMERLLLTKHVNYLLNYARVLCCNKCLTELKLILSIQFIWPLHQFWWGQKYRIGEGLALIGSPSVRGFPTKI